MTFINRFDAGRQLGTALLAHASADPVVLGVLRGGVPVAAEVARVLNAPLELCVVRKLFTPGSPSFAFGAVAEPDAVFLVNDEIAKLRLSPNEVRRAISLELTEVTRLGELLRSGRRLSLRGRDVIVVDDAITGADTLRAAARALRKQAPRSLVLAVPVGDLALIEQLHADYDRVVCLLAEPMLSAVGARYRDFPPVSEAEVAGLLAAARRDVETGRREAIREPVRAGRATS
jgi:putative phosphoribosyl transferase